MNEKNIQVYHEVIYFSIRAHACTYVFIIPENYPKQWSGFLSEILPCIFIMNPMMMLEVKLNFACFLYTKSGLHILLCRETWYNLGHIMQNIKLKKKKESIQGKGITC